MTTWCLLEEKWLRDGRSVYFSPEDEDGIATFESHLRERKLRFVIENRPDVPAVVFSRPAKSRPSAPVSERSAA
jgi:hypothetical protein